MTGPEPSPSWPLPARAHRRPHRQPRPPHPPGRHHRTIGQVGPSLGRCSGGDALAHLAGLLGRPLPEGTVESSWYSIGRTIAHATQRVTVAPGRVVSRLGHGLSLAQVAEKARKRRDTSGRARRSSCTLPIRRAAPGREPWAWFAGRPGAGPVAPQPTALSFWPGRTADRVHVPQPLPVRVGQPGLGVQEPAVAAVFPDQRLYEPEMGPGHVREAVMLDLVVQPAKEPVRRWAAATGPWAIAVIRRLNDGAPSVFRP